MNCLVSFFSPATEWKYSFFDLLFQKPFGLERNNVRFTLKNSANYDGVEVKNTDTPDSLEIYEMDLIKVDLISVPERVAGVVSNLLWRARGKCCHQTMWTWILQRMHFQLDKLQKFQWDIWNPIMSILSIRHNRDPNSRWSSSRCTRISYWSFSLWTWCDDRVSRLVLVIFFAGVSIHFIKYFPHSIKIFPILWI